MARNRSYRVHQHEPATLTAGERREFRRVQRGLAAGDPRWFASRCPRRARQARVIRCVVAALAFALLAAGATTGIMLFVLGGVLVAVGVLTRHVSAAGGRRGPVGGRV